jgi:Ciliary BBSome complex subunit 2, C-terminal
VPIYTDKNYPSVLKISIFIGNSISSREYKIVQIEKSVPKFFMFCPVDKTMPGLTHSISNVKSKLRERSPRV